MKIKYSIFYSISQASVEIIENWIDLVSQCFIPKSFMSKVTSKGKHSKYDRSKLINNLSKELDKDITSIYLTDDNNSFSVIKNYGGKSLIFSFNLEDSEKVNFDEAINKDTVSGKIIVAYKCAYDDHYWQNTDSLLSYQAEGKSLDKVKLTYRKFGLRDQIVDVEYNPGHVHMVEGIWFGSCHKMWFGKEYYHYIPKEKIKNFKDCYENAELENEATRITLYEDIWAYDESQNRKIQWDFRNTVEMDKVAHLLEKCLKTKEIDSDPEIEIETGNFSNGGTRLIKYYYDSNGNLIQKSKAKKVRMCVFDQKGQLLDERNGMHSDAPEIMETAIVGYCKKFQKNLIKRTDKTDVSLFKDEFGFELPDEIADYINIFWHSGISGYTNCPECIVLFPVQKKEGDTSNDILFYENGLISLSRRWNEIGDIYRYIPIGWLGYSGGYVLYEVNTNHIFIEDMNADSDGVVEDKPIADSLKDLIVQLDLK